jgi:dUTP pyrophosphatase
MKTRGFEVVIDEKRKFADKNIKLPTRGSSKAAAYDFYSNDTYTIEPNKIAKIWTDVKAYMGDNEVLLLDVRSSMGGKFMLANTIGVIDADYYSNDGNDGNIGVFLKNISDETLVVNEGDRVAQGMFFTYLVADNGNTDDIRTGGFGSSGK